MVIPMTQIIAEEGPTMKPGYGWKRIAFTHRMLDFGDDVKQVADGQVHNIKVGGFVPRTDPVAVSLMHEMSQYEDFILRIRDNDGRRRLVGTLQETIKFSYKEGNSGGPGTRKGLWFEFAGEFSRPALFLL